MPSYLCDFLIFQTRPPKAAAVIFVLGLVFLGHSNPANEEEREFVSINNRLLSSQRYKSCVCFRAGFGSFRSFKPSE